MCDKTTSFIFSVKIQKKYGKRKSKKARYFLRYLFKMLIISLLGVQISVKLITFTPVQNLNIIYKKSVYQCCRYIPVIE